MRSKSIYWEYLVDGKTKELEIGTITHRAFGQNDFERYGNTISQWNQMLDLAIEKQSNLKEEYEKENGDLVLLEPIRLMDIRSGRTT